MNKALEWAISRILDIVSKGFYGDVTLKFEDGNLTRIEHKQSEKPPAEARG